MVISVFVYSNIHLIIAFALISDLIKNSNKNIFINLHVSDLILLNIRNLLKSGYYDFLLKRKNIEFNLTGFKTPSSDSNFFKKVYGLYSNYLKFSFYKSDLVIVPNFSNFYILFCLKRIKHKRLIYIDEGMSYISFLRFLKNNHRSRSFFFMSLFSKYASPYSLPRDFNINSFVFNKIQFNDIKGISKYNFNLIELKDIFSDFINYINAYKKQIKNHKYTFVVTSPLTDRKYTSYFNEEYDVLYKFLTSYVIKHPRRRIVIKIHYREKYSKYSDLLKISKSISIYKGYLSFQELIISFPYSDIVCFHSSAIFSLQNLNLVGRIYCLCDLIKTPSMKTISNSLKAINWKSVIYVK